MLSSLLSGTEMGQKHNINRDQITLMRAGDLADPSKFRPSDAGSDLSPKSVEDLKKWKLSESEQSGLKSDIEANGVQEPVQLGRFNRGHSDAYDLLLAGHHRVYSAEAVDPDMMVPVKWRH